MQTQSFAFQKMQTREAPDGIPGHLLPGKCMSNSHSHFSFLDESVLSWSPFSLLPFSSRPTRVHGLNKHYIYTKLTKRVSYLLSLREGRFLYKC